MHVVGSLRLFTHSEHARSRCVFDQRLRIELVSLLPHIPNPPRACIPGRGMGPTAAARLADLQAVRLWRCCRARFDVSIWARGLRLLPRLAVKGVAVATIGPRALAHQ